MSMTTNTTTLDCLGMDAEARILAVRAPEGTAARAAALGLCEGRTVRVVKRGEPLVVSVYGCRIGLATALAACIQVAPLAAEQPAQSHERPHQAIAPRLL